MDIPPVCFKNIERSGILIGWKMNFSSTPDEETHTP